MDEKARESNRLRQRRYLELHRDEVNEKRRERYHERINRGKCPRWGGKVSKGRTLCTDCCDYMLDLNRKYTADKRTSTKKAKSKKATVKKLAKKVAAKKPAKKAVAKKPVKKAVAKKPVKKAAAKKPAAKKPAVKKPAKKPAAKKASKKR